MNLRLAPAALALSLAVATATLAHARGASLTTNVDDDRPVITCADIDMAFWRDRRGSGDFVNVRREESVALPALGATPLRVRAADHGGVRVQAAAGAKASASVCLVAAATSESGANAILDQVRIVSTGGELRVTGPEDEDWAAYILLSVPGDAKLDLSAENGGLTAHGVSGQLSLRTTNGPISLRDVAGEVTCEAVNGPISYRGHEGDIRLTAQNGPVTVKLDAPTWRGKGLEASTQNGPVQLSAPDDLKAGVLVEGSRHSPLQWSRTGRSPSGRWSGDRTIRLGEGPVKVRLSTVNGPVQVKGPAGSAEGVDI
jgi:hypothetical protein